MRKDNRKKYRLAGMLMILLSVLLTAGISYAASQAVTFGTYTYDGNTGTMTVTAVDEIDLGTIDLSDVDLNDENTYLVKKDVCIKGAKTVICS